MLVPGNRKVLGSLGVDINAVNSNNASPALVASEFGHVDALRVLGEMGARLDLSDNDGTTAV